MLKDESFLCCHPEVSLLEIVVELSGLHAMKCWKNKIIVFSQSLFYLLVPCFLLKLDGTVEDSDSAFQTSLKQQQYLVFGVVGFCSPVFMLVIRMGISYYFL